MRLRNPEEQLHRDDLARAVKSIPKSVKKTRIEKLREIVAGHQANRVDGLFVDATTASMLVQVHDVLNAENQTKFAALPIRKMATVGWKLVRSSQ
jgi:hypothetical protein